ncbi:MAG: GNAT family N-acetyltransferase [Bacteroidaceae bacterium]|nr:GNAT family N-acetyltransferase [Bacteroidaceae bacterium]
MLRGKRIFLRAAEPEDLDLMYLIENDTVLWAVGSSNVPYSRYALRQFIEQTTNDINTDGQVRLVIALNEGRNAIGFVDLQNYDSRNRRAEVGIVLLPEWQHKGLANEVLDVLDRYASKHLFIYQLYAVVSVDNSAAQALFLNAGYKKTTTLHHWLRNGGEWQDAFVFQKIL